MFKSEEISRIERKHKLECHGNRKVMETKEKNVGKLKNVLKGKNN